MSTYEVLELTTTVERPVIKIDGHAYAMRHPEECSLLEQHYLRQWGQEIADAFKGDELDPEAMSLAEQRLREVVGLIMPELPQAIAQSLSDTQRLAIMRGFTGLAGATPLASVLNGGA